MCVCAAVVGSRPGVGPRHFTNFSASFPASLAPPPFLGWPHRLAFSIVCEMLEDGSICGEPWIGRSVVHNRHTFDYKTATLVIAGDVDAAAKCEPDVVASLQLLASIAHRRRRYLDRLHPIMFSLDWGRCPLGTPSCGPLPSMLWIPCPPLPSPALFCPPLPSPASIPLLSSVPELLRGT